MSGLVPTDDASLRQAIAFELGRLEADEGRVEEREHLDFLTSLDHFLRARRVARSEDLRAFFLRESLGASEAEWKRNHRNGDSSSVDTREWLVFERLKLGPR